MALDRTPTPAAARPIPGSRDLAWHFAIFVSLLGLVYSSTVFLPYALNDENWIVRASGWWARFDIRQGRPLFSLAILATSLIHARIGWNVIRVLRVAGIVGIATSMTMISAWLQWWGWRASAALMVGLLVASLPPFQIYVADATWLVMPFAAAIAAVLMTRAAVRSARRSRRVGLLVAASALVFLSLSFYQPAILIGIGLLIVPVQSIRSSDRAAARDVLKFVALVLVLFGATSVLYSTSWLALWRFLRTVGDPYYSPLALNSDIVARLRYFFSDRMLQAANLWYVDSLRPSPYAYATAVLVAAGLALEIVGAVRSADPAAELGTCAVKYLAALVVLVGSDAIPLMAASPVPSYVTAPAVFFVVAIWLFRAAQEVLRAAVGNPRVLSACGVAACAVGLASAQYTVLTYFSFPLFLEQRLVKGEVVHYLASHPRVAHVHVIGRKDSLLNHGLHEFGWSNATFDVYIRDMVKNVLDDVGVPSEIEVTASDALATTLPRAPVPAADAALVIDLSRIRLR